MNYHHFSRKERATIAKLLASGYSIRQMARYLFRSASSISREIKRNQSGTKYLCAPAQAAYLRRRDNSHRTPKYTHQRLADYVAEKLNLAWSPEQIAGRLTIEFPTDPSMRLSHSTIYRWLEQGLLPRAVQLTMKLRHYGHQHGERRGVKVDARDIRERSRQVFRRKRLGDWEVDTLVSGKSRQIYLLNATERKSRYCCLVLLRNTKKETMMRAFSGFFGGGDFPLITMTSDRGAEFNCHREFENAFHALFYYTRPASPWQKPTVENTNGLIRQFFPKRVNFAELSDDAVLFVMNLLNNRPRKCLQFLTPSEVISHARCT